MADLPRIMEALRKADAAGNTEDAQKLAGMARKFMDSTSDIPKLSAHTYKPYNEPFDVEPPSEPPTEDLGMLPFANRAIATAAGYPLEFLTGVLQEPFLGRKQIETGMKSIGIKLPPEGQKPKAVPEHMGQVVGEVSALMLPIGGATSKLSKGANLTGRIASNIWDSMIRHPYLAMTSELSGAMGAGAARGVAKESFPDSPAAQTTAEIVGGVGGAVVPSLAVHTPTSIAIRTGKNILHKMIIPFTKKGGMYRAGEHVKGLVPSPEVAAKSVGDATISDLPPVVASGEKKLVALYKGLVGQEPLADHKAIEEMTGAMIKLEGEMRKFGYGSPELLEEITKKRIAALELSMDRRVLSASTTAQRKIDALPTAIRKNAESRIVRKELENAMREEITKNQKLWAKVDKDIVTGFEQTRATYKNIFNDLGAAQKVDIPNALKTNSIIKNKKLENTTLREMQSLRSKLLETARNARKEGQWNKARIAEDVSDAILADLESATTQGASDLKAALAATKHFKMRFESGETGRILGYGKSGAPAMDPDLTLEMTVGRMKEKGAIDINKVVVTPEARRATERYLGRSFTDYATDPKTGTLNKIKAERWAKNNEAILDEFPNLKNQLSDATDAQDLADQTRIKMDTRKKALQDPRVSVSAQFLNKANMGQEIDYIFKSAHPSRVSSELVKQANKDTTGEALYGLKAGFVEHILEKSTTGSFNELGERTLSGRAILNFIDTNNPTLHTVFDSKQIARMRTIGRELSKIETFEKISAGKPELELNDWASNTLRMAGRLVGARIGGKIGSESMGGSLQYAQVFSSRGKKFMEWLTRDRAQQLIHDAILSKDPKLLQALLKPIAKPVAKKKDLVFLNKQLDLWLLSTGSRVIDDIDTEEVSGTPGENAQ